MWLISPYLLFSALTLLSYPQLVSSDHLSCDLDSFPSLLDVELDDLVQGLERGLFTSVDLVKAYTARIEEVNDRLHAVTEINPDAEAIAAACDIARQKGEILGPLHGIPILIKNNIATNDKMNNTAGSYALLGAKVSEDSTMAAKLRQAGAILLGKANLSQWANFRSLNGSSGWSAHGGQAYAAYYPGQDPCGSSSGSGTSISLGLALASLGTETSGSIVCPAGYNNIVGIKPTVGLTSRYLVVPISEHQDTIGPMARTVKDAAYLLQAIVGSDPKDNYTSAVPFEDAFPDYVAACKPNTLRGARLGIPYNVLDIWANHTDSTVLSTFHHILTHLQSAGAILHEANFTSFQTWQSDANATLVLHSDFLTNLPTYFSHLTHNPSNLTSLANLHQYTHTNPSEHPATRDTKIWDAALSQNWTNESPAFHAAYASNLHHGGEGGILGALSRYNPPLDAVLLPTQIAYAIPALVGSPIVTVPMGFYPEDAEVVLNGRGNLVDSAPGVPFGLAFLGAKWSEERLIALACGFEALGEGRVRDRGELWVRPVTEVRDVVKERMLGGERVGGEVCKKGEGEMREKLAMVEGWPGVMREKGARRKVSGWVKILGESGKEAVAGVEEET